MNSPSVRWLLDIDSIPEGAEGLRLAWEHPWPAWLWLLLLGGAAALALWSYSRQTAPVVARVVLAATRLLLIVIVLVLLSGPMLEHPRETVEEDWLLVLADRSRSMQIGDAPTEGGRASRDEQLRAALEASSPMWQRLAQKRHVVWLGFSSGAFQLVETAPQAGGPPGVPVELGDAEGARTQLGAAIHQALQQAAARPVSGLVILSDGRTTDPPSRPVVRRLQTEAIPVFAVALGSSEAIGNVAIRRVDAPRRAFVRDKVPVIVELDALGSAASAQEVDVKLVDTLTGEVLDQQTLPPGQTRRVALVAEPVLAGEAQWQVVVETGRPDLIPANNEKSLLIELVDRPLRVLFVDGYPRWEYRYVKNLLVREKSIDSSVMLLSADRDFAQEGNQPITRLPRSPEEFAQFDVIVIGDVPGSFFSLDQLEVIRDQVAQRGTGLLWIGGERYTPRSYTGTVLADLLPMRGSLALPAIGAPVNMVPTDAAERVGVLQLSTSGDVGWPSALADPHVGWSSLNYAQRIEPGRLKPTAEVLAQTAQEFEGAALPLVVHMRYGAGQTMYVATDEIWRWRFGRGEELPEQFWIQMIRLLGRETLVSGGEQALLEAEPRRVAVSQPVTIDLRILDAQLADPRRVTVAAIIQDREGQTVAELELRRVAPGEERFSATYIASTPGELTVHIRDSELASLRLQSNVEVFAPEDELRRPETDHPLLQDLADATGGRILAPEAIWELESLLPDRSVTTVNPLTERLWDTPLFFGLIVLLATLEWVGRKVVRLV